MLPTGTKAGISDPLNLVSPVNLVELAATVVRAETGPDQVHPDQTTP